MGINRGIYIMYFECDDMQYYVGKSGNMKDRLHDHCRKLRYGTHINKSMQKSYYRYGEPVMLPLEEVLDLNKQSAIEIYWIKELDTYYNGTIGGDDLGFGADTPTSLYDKDTYISILKELAGTDKSLRDISNELDVVYSVVQKISNGSEHAWLSMEFPELVLKVSEKCGTRKGLVYSADAYVNAMLLGTDSNNTIESISKTTGLNISVIKNILYGNNHLDLKISHPKEYQMMLSLKGKRRKGTSDRRTYPEVLSPEGVIHSVTNSRQFALTNGLTPSHFHRLLQGKATSHKGWVLA